MTLFLMQIMALAHPVLAQQTTRFSTMDLRQLESELEDQKRREEEYKSWMIEGDSDISTLNNTYFRKFCAYSHSLSLLFKERRQWRINNMPPYNGNSYGSHLTPERLEKIRHEVAQGPLSNKLKIREQVNFEISKTKLDLCNSDCAKWCSGKKPQECGDHLAKFQPPVISPACSEFINGKKWQGSRPESLFEKSADL